MTLVLVVDDEPHIRRTLSINLRAGDDEGETAADGRSTRLGMDELLARIRAAARRGAPLNPEPLVVTTDDFTLDVGEGRAPVETAPRSGSRRRNDGFWTRWPDGLGNSSRIPSCFALPEDPPTGAS